MDSLMSEARKLVVPQGVDGIDGDRAARRDIARGQADGGENEHRGGERD